MTKALGELKSPAERGSQRVQRLKGTSTLVWRDRGGERYIIRAQELGPPSKDQNRRGLRGRACSVGLGAVEGT